MTPSSTSSVPVAPGINLPEAYYEGFLADLDNDPTTLAAYLALVEESDCTLTEDNVDPALWATFQPVFAHVNWKLALKAGDPYVQSVADACRPKDEIKAMRRQKIKLAIAEFKERRTRRARI